MSLQRVYLSLASGSQIKTARRLNYPHILINYATKMNKPPKYPYETLFIDSGGFFSSLKAGMYLTDNKHYLDYIQKVKPDFFALRDFPCEPELLKKHHRSVNDHIRMTVENHVALLDMLPEYSIDAKPVPVLQGWRREDYLHCIDLFNEAGLMGDYMAIGSVCRRTAVENIREVIVAVRDNVPAWVRLHGFGVKLTALRDLAIWNALYSVDSGAWDFEARWKKLSGVLAIPDASFTCAKNYLQKLENVNAEHLPQQFLEA
jgi:hypothetical protein